MHHLTIYYARKPYRQSIILAFRDATLEITNTLDINIMKLKIYKRELSF